MSTNGLAKTNQLGPRERELEWPVLEIDGILWKVVDFEHEFASPSSLDQRLILELVPIGPVNV